MFYFFHLGMDETRDTRTHIRSKRDIIRDILFTIRYPHHTKTSRQAAKVGIMTAIA